MWPAGILLVLSIGIRFLDLDQTLATSFWSAEDRWRWSERGWVLFLYHYGTWPAICAGLGGGVWWVIGRWFGGGQEGRRTGLFLALLLVVGPVILVNWISKENFGRPRPREVRAFGGSKDFHPLGEPGLEREVGEGSVVETGPGGLQGMAAGRSGGGKSFPSGHASTGFFWLGLFVHWWGRHRVRAWVAFGVGMGQGSAMGLARMFQGAHWVSDVLWSAGFIYLTAWVLECLMAAWEERRVRRRVPATH